MDAQTDQAIEWLMRERRQALRQSCIIYGNLVSYKEVPRFIAIKEMETLYLPVPKVGCTNWKKIIMMIEGKILSYRYSSMDELKFTQFYFHRCI